MAVTHPLRLAIPSLAIVAGLAAVGATTPYWLDRMKRLYVLLLIEGLFISGAPWPLETADAEYPKAYAKKALRYAFFDLHRKKTISITDEPEDKEIMDIQRGELEVLLPAQEWVLYKGPATFEVPANSKFKLRVHTLVDYCCSFIKIR